MNMRLCQETVDAILIMRPSKVSQSSCLRPAIDQAQLSIYTHMSIVIQQVIGKLQFIE